MSISELTSCARWPMTLRGRSLRIVFEGACSYPILTSTLAVSSYMSSRTTHSHTTVAASPATKISAMLHFRRNTIAARSRTDMPAGFASAILITHRPLLHRHDGVEVVGEHQALRNHGVHVLIDEQPDFADLRSRDEHDVVRRQHRIRIAAFEQPLHVQLANFGALVADVAHENDVVEVSGRA